jgi:predicted transcriptional regulator
MNKRLETLIARVSALPEEAQDELLDHVALIEARQTGIYHLSDDERAAVQRGLEEARQGKFATDEEVEAVFNRYR